MKLLRALAIVAGLGAIAGALLALVTIGAIKANALLNDLHGGPSLRDVVMLTLTGAGGGSVLGPLVGFGLLRNVPLGQAVLGTGVGALLGIAALFVLAPSSAIVAMLLPPLGMVLAALALRARVGARRRDAAPRDPVA